MCLFNRNVKDCFKEFISHNNRPRHTRLLLFFCDLVAAMPKWKTRTESFEDSRESSDEGPQERQRSRTFASLIRKFSRSRLHTDPEPHEEPRLTARPTQPASSPAAKLSSPGKCATLPARMSLEQASEKPKTLHWMEDEYLDELDKIDKAREGSDESVDSGFEQAVAGKAAAESSESDDLPAPVPAPRSPCVLECRYDEEAVERAFGPMRDIGRWYTTHQRQSRTMEPDLALINDNDRLACRPPFPLPASSVDVSNRNIDVNDGVYEKVEYRLMGTNGLSLSLRDLACYGWYWGPVTRVEAEKKLQGLKDGTFLVRDSSDERYLLSLSFRSQGKTLHTRIEYCNGHFSFYSFPDTDSDGYRSVAALIEHSMEFSKDGVFCFSRARALGSPAVPVRLLKPLSRFNQVRSLQHYCRFAIRQCIRFDLIRQLPLPRHVHGYLEGSQY